MTTIVPLDLRDLYDAARAGLQSFPGPDAARFTAALPADPGNPRALAPVWKPGASQLSEAIPDRRFTRLFRMIRALSNQLEWRQSYTSAEIGDSYLKGMGYVELIGRRGHYASSQIAFGIMVVGSDSLYPDHRHVCEEIYAPIAGHGEWRYDLGEWQPGGIGETVYTASNRWHALRTGAETLVMLYAWLGGDLAQKSEIALPGTA